MKTLLVIISSAEKKKKNQKTSTSCNNLSHTWYLPKGVNTGPLSVSIWSGREDWEPGADVCLLLFTDEGISHCIELFNMPPSMVSVF